MNVNKNLWRNIWGEDYSYKKTYKNGSVKIITTIGKKKLVSKGVQSVCNNEYYLPNFSKISLFKEPPNLESYS